MPTLSFNVTTALRSDATAVAREAVVLAHDFGMSPGLHTVCTVSETVHNVHVNINTKDVFGPRMASVLNNLRKMPTVDAVKVF